ncbi:MAG: hypothetical protein AAFX56_17665 [Pseudomonadota bacterium]
MNTPDETARGDISYLEDLNVRQLQAYAAVCLWAFCVHWRISDDAVRRMVHYLFSITTSESLPDWDQEAVALAIVGRYKDVPVSLLESVPELARPSFLSLVNDCSEVGWVDMYGKNSDRPLQHVQGCLRVLREHDIELPDLSPLRHLAAGSGHWGAAVGIEQARAALDEYEMTDVL